MIVRAMIAGCMLLVTMDVAAHGGEEHERHSVQAHHPAAGKVQAWTQYPLIEETSSYMRNQAVFAVRNMPALSVRIYPPTGRGTFPEGIAVRGGDSSYEALLHQGHFALIPGQKGNYHWITARAEDEVEVRVASSARYFSNPGPAPTEMLAQTKHELEIVPMPLPREHWHYREGEKWNFLVRFHGLPLAETHLRLVTEHGSRLEFATDRNGLAEVTIPADLPSPTKNTQAGHHGRQKAGFVLVAEHDEAKRHYVTTFNYYYIPSAMRGKSLMTGAIFMGLGGLLATPLLRRTRHEKKERSDA